jgi:hypothetical protein
MRIIFLWEFVVKNIHNGLLNSYLHFLLDVNEFG